MLWLLWMTLAFAVDGLTLREVEHASGSYTVVEIDPRVHTVELYGQTERLGAPQTFAALNTAAAGQQLQVLVAMNAGMYLPNYRPVGLHVEGGVQKQRLVKGPSGGNFGLLPNGVFVIDEKGARVVNTVDYASLTGVRLATQSGPALVLNGHVHPVFKADSKHMNVRNGVGVRTDGTVVFVISRTRVRFYDFATLYRDVLQCPNALYLDGAVSALWTAEQPQRGGRYSGILAVTTGR